MDEPTYRGGVPDVEPAASSPPAGRQATTAGAAPAPGGQAGPTGIPGLLAVDHVGVAVADLDQAVAFHTEVLGLVLTHRETNLDQQVSEAMLGTPGAPPGAAQVQLLAPTGPGSPLARFLDRSGPGLQQLAYRVEDVVAAAAHLSSRGVRVLYPEPRRGTAGSLVNFAHPKDCGGVLVELVQAGDGPAPTPRTSTLDPTARTAHHEEPRP